LENFLFYFPEKNSLQQWIYFTVAPSAQLLREYGKPDSFTSSKAGLRSVLLKEFYFFLNSWIEKKYTSHETEPTHCVANYIPAKHQELFQEINIVQVSMQY